MHGHVVTNKQPDEYNALMEMAKKQTDYRYFLPAGQNWLFTKLPCIEEGRGFRMISIISPGKGCNIL